MNDFTRAPELVSVVLPVFNEHENIAVCLRGLWRALAGCEHEILVCYDFDEDTTLAAIASMPDRPPSVRLVKNTLGRGAPNAIRAGFQAAKGDVIVTSMADLSDPPEVILAMAEKIRREGADVVAGSRYAPGGSQTGGPLLKRVLSECAGRSLAWIAGVRTSDATSNFRAYSRRFLERATIESRAGFEIALELTVKAHLAGAKVDEVPSSWVDRTAGKSRFRLWKWLPNYLRWYLRAALAPIAVWVLWATLLAHAVLATRGSGNHRALELAFVAACAATAALAVLGARSTRGRTAWIDLLLPALWLNPAALPALRANRALAPLALGAAWSVAHVACIAGWSRRAEWIPRWHAWITARLTAPELGLLLFACAVWIARFTLPAESAAPELDPSWSQALGVALRQGMQFGVDIVFTYGPLGYFNSSRYDPALLWSKVLWWDGLLKLVLTGYLVLASVRLVGGVSKLAYLVALFWIDPGQDGFYLISIACVAVTHVARERPTTAWTLLDCAILAVVALVKFNFFALACACVAAIALWEWARAGFARAATTLALFTGALAIVWGSCGQSFANFPAYLRHSAWIASGYNEAMSLDGPERELVWSAWIAIAYLVIAVAFLASRRRARWVTVAIVAATLAMTFKSGFVRHTTNSATFFAVAAIVCFQMGDVPVADRRETARRAWGVVQAGGRFACLAIGLYGYGSVLGHAGHRAARLIGTVSDIVCRNLEFWNDVAGFRRDLESHRAIRREQNALPQVRARVGGEPIDQIFCGQAVLFLNDLNWRPRPVFQSYAAYTQPLLELNGRFFESEKAPPFALLRVDGIDWRLPGMDDSLALDALLRDYDPVLGEQGYVLFERRAPADRPARGPRPLLEDRALAMGEWCEVDATVSQCESLALEIEYTPWGRIESMAYKSPIVELEFALSDGSSHRYRIVPAMVRAGVLLRPFLPSQEQWVRWLSRAPVPAIVRFRWVVPKREHVFAATARMRRYVADDVAPRASSETRLLYSMFDRDPTTVTTAYMSSRVQLGGLEVLVVHAPSELAFPLPPRARYATLQFGILPEACHANGTDGAGFRVVGRDAQGVERVLFERTLDPVRVAADREPQSVRVRFPIPPPVELLLRTDPGPSGAGGNDWAYWTALEIR